MKGDSETEIELINFQGINCYYNSIATLVNDLGLDYRLLFADLWSEYDLLFDEKSSLYLSKRLIANLSACGAKILTWDGNPEKAFGGLRAGEKAVVGFDSFDVFWNSTYRSRHGSHYFIVRKEKKEEFAVFDPTLNKTDIQISAKALAASALDFFEIAEIPPDQTRKTELLRVKKEAERAEKTIPKLKVRLLTALNGLEAGGACIGFAKYCDGLTNNRFMFRHFVSAFFNPDPTRFMPDSYMVSFVAVKNGLYKLSLTGDAKTKKQIAGLLSVLLNHELRYAAFLREREYEDR